MQAGKFLTLETVLVSCLLFSSLEPEINSILPNPRHQSTTFADKKDPPITQSPNSCPVVVQTKNSFMPHLFEIFSACEDSSVAAEGGCAL